MVNGKWAEAEHTRNGKYEIRKYGIQARGRKSKTIPINQADCYFQLGAPQSENCLRLAIYGRTFCHLNVNVLSFLWLSDVLALALALPQVWALAPDTFQFSFAVLFAGKIVRRQEQREMAAENAKTARNIRRGALGKICLQLLIYYTTYALYIPFINRFSHTKKTL